MSASLDASTVTPGSTAPEVSFTTPVNALWACAAMGSRHRAASAMNRAFLMEPILIPNPPGKVDPAPVIHSCGQAVQRPDAPHPSGKTYI